MSRSVPVPMFRPFKHPELLKMRLADGDASAKDVAELVKNTNFLIAKGLHIPGYRLTHTGSEDKNRGKSLGWVEIMKVSEDGRAIGYSDFTEVGKDLIRKKEVRWVSSGIKRDFRLTGEPDGPVLPGLYLDHVAVLGDENPAVKGLVDLSQVQLAEGASVRPGSESFTCDEEEGEVCYFAEINLKKEIQMESEKKKEDESATSMFKELMKKNEETLKALEDEKVSRLKLQAELDSLKNRETEAQFAEHQSTVEVDVKDIQKKAGLGAEFAEAAKEVGAAIFGNKKAVPAFKKMLAAITRTAPKNRILDEEQEEDRDEESNMSEIETGLTEKDMLEAAFKPVVAAKVNSVLRHRQEKNSKFSFADLRKEVTSRKSAR